MSSAMRYTIAPFPPLVLEHGPSWGGRAYGLLLQLAFRLRLRTSPRSGFWQTEINEQGLLISQRFTKPVLIPVSAIRCLDLSGLFPSRVKGTRFLLVMSENSALLQRAQRFSNPKCWMPGSNILLIGKISGPSAEGTRVQLDAWAKRHKIKQDLIVLENASF
jgi:hypothetical protein